MGIEGRPSYRAFLATFVIAAALHGRLALAGEAIKPTLDVKDMRVTVAYVSIGELERLEREFGPLVDVRDVRQDTHRGFSILKRNRETGLLTCEIYLPYVQRPTERDDQGTLTLGHELLHCMLGKYHR